MSVSSHAPEACASTNSATSAQVGDKYTISPAFLSTQFCESIIYTIAMQAYRFCPFCGEIYNNDQLTSNHKYCEQCGKWVFENLKATGSAVIIHENKLLLVKRGIEPNKGLWDVPGGFSEPQEHPEETTLREVQEELGVEGEIVRLYAIYSPVPYVYQGTTQHNCDLYYVVRLKSLAIQVADDAADFAWFPLDELPSLDQMAFRSTKQLIQDLRKGTSNDAITNSPE